MTDACSRFSPSLSVGSWRGLAIWKISIVSCHMQKGRSSAFLCAELCLHEVRHVWPENDDFRKIHIKHSENTQEHSSLLYESPGGNQFDGGAKHSPLASALGCPEGGNRGGHRDLWQGHGFSHFSCRKNQRNKKVSLVPDTSRCVDSESAIDSSLSLHLMLGQRPWSSELAESGVNSSRNRWAMILRISESNLTPQIMQINVFNCYFHWFFANLKNRHTSRFRPVVAWMLINFVQHNIIYVIKFYYLQ